MLRGNVEAARGSGLRVVQDVDHRLIFERTSAPCIVLALDSPRFEVVAVSDAYLALGRARREDCLGKAWVEALRSGLRLAEGQIASLQQSLEQALMTRVTTQVLLDVPEPRPSTAHPGAEVEPSAWAVVNTPIWSEDGACRYLVQRIERIRQTELAREESERVRLLERALAERTLELQDAVGALDALGYSVSHDFRAPLRAIDGFSQALAHDYGSALDERAHHWLDRVRAGAQRMSGMIDDLLELSRIQRAPLRRSQVDLSALARRHLDQLARRCPERHVRIEISPDLSVHADPHLSYVLLSQLLDNAWKFTSKRLEATIRVGREPGDRAPVWFVADDGVGFDMAYAGRLCSPFQRLHKASDFEGRGIGLALAQRAAARHGGRVWAEAHPGAGARFRFTLQGACPDGGSPPREGAS